MNVIVSNKNEELLSNLDIDLIKSINGEFTPEELASQFPSNFYFNKMVLDITAIKNYDNINVIQELSLLLDMSKVVLFLDESEIVNSPTYLSQLVSMGIYNFTKTLDAVKFLIVNPNSYKDVASYHQLNNVAAKPFTQAAGMDVVEDTRLRVIGFKNVTSSAGSTTLCYLLKKQLEKYYSVIAVENKANDFMYLNDKSLQTTDDLSSFINKNQRCEVILVDLNDSSFEEESLCTEVVYLIEPGLIKLNKLIRKDNGIFEKLKGKKIILNRSVLNDKDVQDFEYESNSKIFFNIPNLDDKKDFHKVLEEFLIQMEFRRFKPTNEGKGKNLFSLFK